MKRGVHLLLVDYVHVDFFLIILLHSNIFSFLCHVKRWLLSLSKYQRMADILKKWRCTNALSAELRISQIHYLPHGKAIANAHYGSLYIPILYILTAWAYGIAYLWKMGNARASEFGMSNRSDSRAFSFVFSEMNLLEFRCWECAEEKDKRKHLKIKQI